MKEILISIKPEWVAKILNGEKTIEIRKTMPKCEFPVKVYIYCTKGNENLYLPQEHDCWEYDEASALYLAKEPLIREDIKLNGKIVAKFTLNKAKKILPEIIEWFEVWNIYGHDECFYDDEILEMSCLSEEQLENYIGDRGFAWFISDLKIFDEPKELKDFGLTKAPQSWQYIKNKGNYQNGL